MMIYEVVKQMMINENADNYDRETSEYIIGAYLDLLGVTSRLKNNFNTKLFQVKSFVYSRSFLDNNYY